MSSSKVWHTHVERAVLATAGPRLHLLLAGTLKVSHTDEPIRACWLAAIHDLVEKGVLTDASLTHRKSSVSQVVMALMGTSFSLQSFTHEVQARVDKARETLCHLL